MAVTVNYSFELPTVGGDLDTWGDKLNANWTSIDTIVNGIDDTVASLSTNKQNKSSLKADVIAFIYPIGSIYLSVNAVNPSTFLPGTTWVAKAQGRALVGVGTADSVAWAVNQTRGEATVALTVDEMPTHDHSVNPPATVDTTSGASNGHTHSIDPPSTSTSSNEHNHGGVTTSGGQHIHKVVEYTASGNSGMFAIDQPPDGTNQIYSSTGDLAFLSDLTELRNDMYTDGANNTADGDAHSHAIPNYEHSHTVNIAPFTSGGQSDNHTHTVTVDIPTFNSGNAGSGDAHNNIQPSIAIYIWQRTA